MHYKDHLPAHFHAQYGEHEVAVFLESGLIEGRFPKRALRHILEWYDLHRGELEADWDLARQEKPLNSIAPLE